ncbi:putative nicotinamide mononucleotide transporter [Kitasatospora indigofera]|uniref:Nicotinamide mononucleotide transporter n=1 Tax=Kitasatospora indigofera TaxID=67307 RepID=A0A919KY62_9ACTN|nr:nicotinamide riboside transporter PnuC [Kitasatospora indigofera]GHH77172.1 putative nicotinamide mononucleotide transporter [Kitasatospora indigofera]
MPITEFLSDLTAPLTTVLGHVGGDEVTWAELLGFATGAACVWLTVKGRTWNFPVGIANNVFFLVLFAGARLYADAALQVVFLALGAHGWWQWLRGGAERTGVSVRPAGPGLLAATAALLVPVTWGLTVLLARAGDSAPFWDALTTALSLAAQWLLNTRRIETWYFWIAADLVYIPLYLSKSLDLTALVYLLFLGLCGLGLRAWRRDLAAVAGPEPTAVPA